MTEYEKIQHLLVTVEKSNLIFIRNGTRYSAKRARAHLEHKLKLYRNSIHTADDFIKLLATKSSLSGKPYYVILKAGKRIKLSIWLSQKLMEFERR